MPEIIPADNLQVGDVYRSFSGLRVLNADAYQVHSIRTVRSVETYRVIEATNLRTGLAASINLLRDVEVARLAVVDRITVRNLLDGLADGEHLHVVRANGMLFL